MPLPGSAVTVIGADLAVFAGGSGGAAGVPLSEHAAIASQIGQGRMGQL
jgi:hypothetical protein